MFYYKGAILPRHSLSCNLDPPDLSCDLSCDLCVDVVAPGGGQYGDVYEGMWKRYNKIVAVKTLKVSDTLVAAIVTLVECIQMSLCLKGFM